MSFTNNASVNIVFFTHPAFFQCQSIHRYTKMLAEGMIRKGHQVEVWSPEPHFFNLPVRPAFKKWMGYIDQYILFPNEIRNRIKKCSPATLFVFTDQALGPWVPLVIHRPHVIHCHDFLAQRSALGDIAENKTTWSGRKYQSFIHNGYSKGRYFISVSNATKQDLYKFLSSPPLLSDVVYNGFNQSFSVHTAVESRTLFGKRVGLNLIGGYFLHLGGNPWYKNRIGVIEMYNAFRSTGGMPLPLLFVGDGPSTDLFRIYNVSPYKEDIYFLSGIEDEFIGLAYAGATIFLFPSLAEGFGWPIAEAMASGCPVITTGEAPMTEVASTAGFYISRRPHNPLKVAAWAQQSAEVIKKVIELSSNERQAAVNAGMENVKRFDTNLALDKIESIYKSIMNGN